MKRRLLSRQRAVNKWTRQGSSIPFSSLQSENEGHSIISLLSGNNMPDFFYSKSKLRNPQV